MNKARTKNTPLIKPNWGGKNNSLHGKENGLLIDKLQKRQLIIQLNRFLDVLLSLLAYIAAYSIRKFVFPSQTMGLNETPDYVIIGLFMIIIWFITFIFIKIN